MANGGGQIISNVGMMLKASRSNAKPSYSSAYVPGCEPALEKPAYVVNITPPPPPDPNFTSLSSVKERSEKNKYEIGETKEEIVNNIISKKASVANVRKALHKYADIIMEQDLF